MAKCYFIDPIPNAHVKENELYTLNPAPNVSSGHIGVLTYSIKNTADSGYFTMSDTSTGVVTMQPKDFENPEDSGFYIS